MKVLALNSVYEYGSTGRIVSDIHKACLKQGIDSYVIFSREGAYGKNKKEFREYKNVYKINNKLEEKIHLVKGVLFDKHGLYSKKNTLEIIKKIKEINPDIIHLHNIHGFYLNYEIFFEFLRQFNKQVIWTMHDCWAFTGFHSYFEYLDIDYKDGCVKDKHRNVYPYRVFINSKDNFNRKKKAFKLNNLTIVTPSMWLKDVIKNTFLNKNEIVVINNSVDTNIFRKKDVVKNSDKILLLGVASVFTKQKGYEEYLKLADKLDDKYEIVLIGLSKKQIKSLPENIFGIERTENIEELVDWYNKADIFVNLTLEDNYPTVNLEALACGLPCITYRTGGSSEMIEGKGIVVDKYDIEALVKAIKTISLDKHVYVNKLDMAEEYIKLYESRKI